MMPIRKTIVVAVSASVAALALGAGVASAHTVRFDSQVTAHFTEQPGPPAIDSDAGWDYFSGRVNSTKQACKSRREVYVFLKQRGEDPLWPTQTNGDGFWRLLVEDPPNDTYYARALRKVLRNTSAHSHVCKAARSQDVVVAGQP
jgi:hypothetical protein